MNKIRLDEVVSLQNGYAFKSKDFLESGIPVVKIKNVKPDGLTLHKLDFIAKEMITDKLKKYIIPDDSILVTLSGNRYGGNPETWVGKACYYNTKNTMLLNQRVASLTSKDSEVLNTRWLAYLLGSWKYQEKFVLMSNSSGGQANISPSDVLSLEINLPSLQEQKAIAEVLSSLDDKIELLQKQNDTLEALAQTLFRQWFIEEADDSWEEVELGTLVDTFNGISYKSSQLKESDVAMVTLKSFARDGSFRLDGFKEFVGEYKDRHECSNGDILVAHTDVTQGALLIGNAIEVRQPKEYRQLLYSMDLVKVVPKNVSDKYFILYTLKNRHFKHHAVGYSNGSTVLHMSKKAVPEFRLKHPPTKLIHDFHEKVSAFKEKQRLNESSIVTLKQTRDTLLPKLMSGQVRVKLD